MLVLVDVGTQHNTGNKTQDEREKYHKKFLMMKDTQVISTILTENIDWKEHSFIGNWTGLLKMSNLIKENPNINTFY